MYIQISILFVVFSIQSILFTKSLRLKLSGIIITEYNRIWSEEDIEKLKRTSKSGELLILRGREIISPSGHLLIFGYYDEVKRGLSTQEILDKVHRKGGIVIMAHPFRYGNSVGEDLERLRNRFVCVDAIEVFSGNQNRDENEYGKRVWEALGLVGVGGSDAHSIEMVGRCLTWFQNTIRNEDDLILEIKAGRCRPVIKG
ncbi:TPA: hypothetical protein DCX15_02360 [bacterium]|nr:hypothetical protein [bacterium]